MTKEDSLTIAVADYLRYQYKDVFWAHIANERQTSPARGAKLKRMGVRAGMPDIMIWHPSLDHGNGLAIELKVKPNKPTKKQEDCLNDLYEKAGWYVAVCYTFEEAKELIDTHLK